jgi:hypothetical protein
MRMGPVIQITFCLSCLCKSQRTFRILDGDRIPHGGLGGPPSTFLALMVGTPKFSGSTFQGARRRYFLTLIVDTPRSPSAPARGSAIYVF